VAPSSDQRCNAYLADVRARKVDVVVVYKADRLSRSLADFAKLVELFDDHGVSHDPAQMRTLSKLGK
jgi:hypothetical protein